MVVVVTQPPQMAGVRTQKGRERGPVPMPGATMSPPKVPTLGGLRGAVDMESWEGPRAEGRDALRPQPRTRVRGTGQKAKRVKEMEGGGC